MCRQLCDRKCITVLKVICSPSTLSRIEIFDYLTKGNVHSYPLKKYILNMEQSRETKTSILDVVEFFGESLE